MKKICCLLLVAILCGCAANPKVLQVSTGNESGFNCERLAEEIQISKGALEEANSHDRFNLKYMMPLNAMMSIFNINKARNAARERQKLLEMHYRDKGCLGREQGIYNAKAIGREVNPNIYMGQPLYPTDLNPYAMYQYQGNNYSNTGFSSPYGQVNTQSAVPFAGEVPRMPGVPRVLHDGGVLMPDSDVPQAGFMPPAAYGQQAMDPGVAKALAAMPEMPPPIPGTERIAGYYDDVPGIDNMGIGMGMDGEMTAAPGLMGAIDF